MVRPSGENAGVSSTPAACTRLVLVPAATSIRKMPVLMSSPGIARTDRPSGDQAGVRRLPLTSCSGFEPSAPATNSLGGCSFG